MTFASWLRRRDIHLRVRSHRIINFYRSDVTKECFALYKLVSYRFLNNSTTIQANNFLHAISKCSSRNPMILNFFFNAAGSSSVPHYIYALRSKNFIRCYHNTGNHFLYAFLLVPFPKISHPNSHSEITGRTLMGMGRLKKAKSASQNESK